MTSKNCPHDTHALLFWCNTHQRRAATSAHCAPGLPGITFPCQVVDLTGLCEIIEKSAAPSGQVE